MKESKDQTITRLASYIPKVDAWDQAEPWVAILAKIRWAEDFEDVELELLTSMIIDKLDAIRLEAEVNYHDIEE